MLRRSCASVLLVVYGEKVIKNPHPNKTVGSTKGFPFEVLVGGTRLGKSVGGNIHRFWWGGTE